MLVVSLLSLGRPDGGAQPTLRTMSGTPAHLLRAPPPRGPPARYFTQQLDHFDASASRTWQQAYYVNDTYWVPGSDAPVYLCVGGEGPALDGSAVRSSVHCNVAVEMLPATKALMFAVEHRYYGCHNMSACPYTREDEEPLRWLSSRQALADLAAFHRHATAAYALAPANRWVTFGGSYPGMLAGWARLLYPSLFFASISSSAPVIAKLDMHEYNDIVADAYALESVGGSSECRQAIAVGHKNIGHLMNTSYGRRWLAMIFPHVESAEWLEDVDNQRSFAADGVAYFPAQDNDPACTGADCDIARICEVTRPLPFSSPFDLAPGADSPAVRAACPRGAAESLLCRPRGR